MGRRKGDNEMKGKNYLGYRGRTREDGMTNGNGDAKKSLPRPLLTTRQRGAHRNVE
jgi:hypothetical protein